MLDIFTILMCLKVKILIINRTKRSNFIDDIRNIWSEIIIL